MVGPAAKREAVAHLRNVVQMSERRACTAFPPIARRSDIGRAGRPMSSCAPGCGISPTSATGSATVGCSSYCGERASHPGSTASIGSIVRRG